MEKHLVISVKKQFKFLNLSKPHVLKLKILNRILFKILIFRNENDRAEGHEEGGVAKDTEGKEVEQ